MAMRYPSRNHGIALVLVLWVIALLTVVALSVVSLTRTETQLTRNRLDQARLNAMSEAALSMAALRLNSGDEEDVWYPDGSPREWSFAGTPVEIRLYNEPSRIDLNMASDTLLEKLLIALGESGTDAATLTKRIMDWRDKDDSERALGAEDASYKAEGMPFGSADQPFRSVAELGQVLGIRADLLAAMKPHVTVHGGTARVDREYASPLVQAVLADQSIDRTVRNPQDQDSDGGDDQDDASRQNRGGPVYRLRVRLQEGAASETLFRNGGRNGITLIWRRYDWSEPKTESEEEDDESL